MYMSKSLEIKFSYTRPFFLSVDESNNISINIFLI